MKLNINLNIRLLLLSTFVFYGTLLWAQSIKVTGKVTDGKEPLIGVSIFVNETKIGTITDLNGNYTISAPSTGTLVVSYLGYESRSESIKNRIKIDFSLNESAKSLDEVVVVGYGTMKKRDITGAIVSLSAKDLSSNEPVNIATALQGKVAGLEILTSSDPGSSSVARIRGASTLSEGGSDPLYVIDGMEVDNLNSINPRDIASVEVLKDAASTAIYGSKSANGVILITTKQGQEGKPRVSINYTGTASNIAHKLSQMSRLDGLKHQDLINYLTGAYTTITDRDSLNPSYSADNFYQDILYRTAITHQIDASISGGDKKFKYFLSLGDLNQQGIQINSYNKRISSRVNMDYYATPKLTVGSRMTFTKSDIRTTNARQWLLGRDASYAVTMPDGSYAPLINARGNPLAEMMLAKNDDSRFEVSMNDYLQYAFLPELKFRTSINASLYFNKKGTFKPALLDLNGIRYSTDVDDSRYNWTQENTLTFNKKFNNKHDVTALLGFSMQQKTAESLSLSVSNNLTDIIQTSYAYQTVNMAQTLTDWTQNSMASFFGRLSYNYKGKYLFNSNVRYDGSTRFGADKRWGLFPSVSLGWRFSDEKFMKWLKPALNDGKLRLSYGITGNQSAGDFSTLALYAPSYYADMVGVYPSQLENKNLGWEQTEQSNIGLDLNFLDGRINFVADYYYKATSDVLYPVKVPQTTGFSTSFQNIGNVDNKGFEITLSTTNIKTKDFEWKTSANVAFNQNLITYIPTGGRQFSSDGVYIIDKGYSLGTIWGWEKLAIFQYDQSNAFTPDWQQLTPIFDSKDRFTGYQLNGLPYTGTFNQLRRNNAISGPLFKGGDVMWNDLNKDGAINADDQKVLGNGQPDLMGSLNTDIKYKNFTFSALFSFVVGGDIFNYPSYYRNRGTTGATRPGPDYLSQTWQAPGDIAKYPKPYQAGSLVDNTRLNSNLWIEEGSYIRLKNIRLSYELPKKITKFLKIETASVYGMMQNYFTWTKYTGFDPEVVSNGFSIGYDNNAYPRAKDIIFGLNLNF
jgi:TonB-linked SusC/RagA family outer membrane protein